MSIRKRESGFLADSYYAFAEHVEVTRETVQVHFDAIPEINVNGLFDLRPELEPKMSSKLRSVLIYYEFDRKKLVLQGRDTILEGRWYLLPSVEVPDTKSQSPYQFYSLRELSWSNYPKWLNRRSPEVRWLESVFSLNSVPDATSKCIEAALRVSKPSSVVCYNVGQGSCAAICGEPGNPLAYFDFGGSFGINASTYPLNLEFCIKGQPVILSHWHMDHWISAEHHPEITRNTWIVPRQGPLAPRATQLAYRILENGNLLIWPSQQSRITTSIGDIVKLSSHDVRNHSGLVVFAKVKFCRKTYTVLVPGDAAYRKIPVKTGTIHSMIATHHGGWHRGDKPPAASTNAVIAYSYGEPNTYDHPKPVSTATHDASGWYNRYNTPNGHIRLTPTTSRTFQGVPCLNECTLSPVQP